MSGQGQEDTTPQVEHEESGVQVHLLAGDEDEIANKRNVCLQAILIICHLILCLVNLVCLGVTSTFDTVCAVKQAKSIVNCTEKVIFIQKSLKPQYIAMLFCSTTIINAIVVMTILYIKPFDVDFCGFKEALKKLMKKGSFWSLNITFIFVILDYIIIVTKPNLETANKALSILLVGFFASKLIVAYFLNYVVPVKLPPVNQRNLSNFARFYFWLAYWITLMLFFLATAYVALAITLDVTEKISPLGKVHTASRNYSVVAHLVFMGIRATFEVRLFLFYWNKIFHGEKNLFATINVLKPIKDRREQNIEQI